MGAMIRHAVCGALAVAVAFGAAPAAGQKPEDQGKAGKQAGPAGQPGQGQARQADDSDDRPRQRRKRRMERRRTAGAEKDQPRQRRRERRRRGAGAEGRGGGPGAPGKGMKGRGGRGPLGGMRQGTPEMREARVEMRTALDEGNVEAAREAARRVARERAKLRKARGPERSKRAKARLERDVDPEQRKRIAQRVRMARWKALRARYGRPNANPRSVSAPLRAELRRHAKRMAQLQRVRLIAMANENDELTERVDVLEELERARHQRRLERIDGTALSADPGEEPPRAGEQETEDAEEEEE